MYKIIFIDGGEGGRRVEKLTDTIRQRIPKEELTVHRSVSRLNTDNEYHSLKGYDIAFVHNSDNINDKMEPVFTLDAKANNVPLVLYSGGMRGFKLTSFDSCEINDSLLLEKVTPFLQSMLWQDFNIIDFNYLFPGEKYICLERLFNFRNLIIQYHESGNSLETDYKLRVLLSYLEDLNIIKENDTLSTLADYPDKFMSIIKFINKNILRYEKNINNIS